MKLVIYNLNDNGTIPDYIIDGGYFAIKNNKNSPQDYDLVGVAIDEINENVFVNENALLEYVQEKNLTFTNPITNQLIPSETVVSSIWSKLGDGNN